MIRRQNGEHTVTHEHRYIKVGRERGAYKAAVNFASAQCVLGVRILHVLKLKDYPRVAQLKLLEYRRQALRGKARARADADEAGLQTLEGVCLLLQ